MTLAAVMLGGAAGAVLRHAVREWAGARGHAEWGTLAVNVAGAGTLGLMLGADWPGWLVTGVATGAIGALTTVSSFALDVVNQSERADHGGVRRISAYIVATLAFGLGAACSTLL